MSGAIDRKAFVTALGAAGLGLGLAITGAGRAPLALAQEATPPAAAGQAAGPLEQRLEQRQELYADFTAALASELGIVNADEVDAGIRKALISVIDARVGEGVLTAGQGDALKSLVAAADVPFGPLVMVGAHGDFMHGERGGRMGPGWDDDHRGMDRDKNGGDRNGDSPAADANEG